MKLTAFLYETTRYVESNEEWPVLNNRSDYPFEIPDDEWDRIEKRLYSKCTKMEELFESYVKENNIETVTQEEDYLDLDKGYRRLKVVFSFKDKYYEYYFDEGSCGYEECSNINKELTEVVPYEETITVTKWKEVK